ncbi:ABC-type transporter Mla maintaining outer membrane lipid asymmetry, lipoprotein component MlaA [Mariprofundus aestuarium]|uniref:ABC-type transporter Mla maintaining outer membrane lipid asymmetry, lipoprotein component MlaA n=1 Tax=Mariprofundus aestuarium TaxID=1921086 RepID=A0A2K8KVR9_MARES|nr:MlaA family lipoprotein [Mariprofundus aestuarium]ATX78928.1 ABC-type transporter Mla maintaining outer membrane lipid asymmetry, lipoprotein component MlaA [Mariprofundus aestuarium]
MNRRPFNLILTLLLAVLLSACATTENNHDPIEPVNRVTDKVNDGIDRVTLKPVARGYTAAVPKPMRTAVSNFYDNATYLNTVLNDFLQGKGKQGFSDLFRFLINTTLGAGGLVDVASSMGLERHDEDFGQTLAVWGSGQGAYIVYPLLGPNSVRNTPDFITATATDPLFWLSFTLAPAVTIPVAVLKYVDQRAQLLEASDMRDELALDPYVFTREAWRQNRQYLIYDGTPPKPEKSSGDGWEEDNWGSEENGFEEDEFDKEPEPAPDMQDDTPASPAAELDESAAAPAGRSGTKTASRTPGDQAFIINLASFETEANAIAAQEQLSTANIRTSIKEVTVNDAIWQRLYISDSVGGVDANRTLAEMKARSGLSGAWLEPVKP